MATSGYYRFIGAVVKTVSNPLTLERFASLLGSARMRSTARNPIYMSHLKRVFPSADEKTLLGILREHWRKHERNNISLFFMKRITREKLDGLVEWRGRNLLEQALGRGKGLLLLAPHYGDERSLHILLGMAGYSVGVMTSRYSNMPPPVRRMKLECGNRWNELHFPGDSPRWMFDTLLKGDVVHFAPTAYGGPSGTWVGSFGVPVLAPSSPWKLHARTGCSLVLGFNTQLPGMRFRMEFQEIPRCDNRQELIQKVFDLTERKARECPGQYDWDNLLIRHRESNTIARLGRIPENEVELESATDPDDLRPDLIPEMKTLR